MTPGPGGAPLLEARGLRVCYGPVVALDGVDVDVWAGQATVVLGANGAGKTSALRAVARLVQVTGGTVLFRGERLRGGPDAVVRAGVAHVPEGRQIFGSLTVAENLALGAYGRRGPAVEEDRQGIFALFPILRERSHQRAGGLSGGEQQMLAIGRALMAHPSLLLLDEPSLGLSPRKSDEIFDAIRLLRDRGLGVLLVEQKIQGALALADRVLVFRGGRVVASGTPAEMGRPEVLADAYLGLAATATPATR